MTKMVRMVSLLLIVFFTLAVFGGCGSQAPAKTETPASETSSKADTAASKSPDKAAEPADDKLVIGCAMQGNQSTFIQYIAAGMWKYQKENAPNVTLDVVFADDDAAKQVSQIETFIAKKVGAIVINPVDKVQSAAAVDAAAEVGIPVITVNTISDSKNVTAHVGSDDVEAGKLQMQRLIDVCGKDANVAYVNAVLGHSAQVFREIGYKEILDANPTVKLAAVDTANWSAEEALKLVENWLQSGKQIDAIACQADCQLLGVITAVENAGMIGKIKLSGMDCVNEVMDAIEDGRVDSSIWQDGVGQGEHSIRLAIDAANGKAIEDYMIPYEVCTKDNIEKYRKLAAERDALAKEYF
ncbi:MAG: substrate-binding domain-containing protein [Acetivibrionales bacterium]|jgi:inositol transport system substrate-binding protein